MAWTLLIIAIAWEIVATMSLKASAGFSRPGYVAVLVVMYVTAFALLSRVLEAGIPVGVTYGVWSAVGIAAVAALSWVVFDERLSTTTLAGLAIIIAGVVVVQLGTAH